MKIVKIITIWLEFLIKCAPLLGDLIEAMESERKHAIKKEGSNAAN